MNLFRLNSVLLFTFCFYLLSSQRGNNWYFGINNGINFNTNPPSTVSNGQCTNSDYTSTMSDIQGNLLFYTDGASVWNNQHTVMPNGFGLIGNISAGQCALIIPIPSDLNKYVIFHTTEFSSPGNLNYTVVDMSLNGGLGDVIPGKKNVSLGSGWTEKMCAYYSPSGNNYWLLVHKWQSDQFVAYNINATTIATQSVVSVIGSNHNCGVYSGAHDAMGQLTISPDGLKVINAITCQDTYELFDFNAVTGVLTNSISIGGNVDNAWGTAFSPDSKKIYVCGIFSQSVFQYDISNYNQSAIIASKLAVGTVSSTGYNFAYMELAPNNKIYIAKPNATSLAVINNPNSLGSACNFTLNGQALTNSCQWGLSRIAYNIPTSKATGIDNFNNNNNIKLYPNPTQDYLVVESIKSEIQFEKLTIYNLFGQTVYSNINCGQELEKKGKLTIPVNSLPRGIYQLIVSIENATEIYKFIKE